MRLLRTETSGLAITVLATCFFILMSCTTKYKPIDFADAVMIENIPFFSQDEYQCGPASLAAVLNYWGVKVSPEEIAEEIYSKSARGTLDIDILLYAQKNGLNALQYSGDIGDLRENIKSGLPVVVLVDYGFYVYQANHFMVVVGFNKKGVFVNSGREREKFIPEEDFIKSWKRTDFWTLLIK